MTRRWPFSTKPWSTVKWCRTVQYGCTDAGRAHRRCGNPARAAFKSAWWSLSTLAASLSSHRWRLGLWPFSSERRDARLLGALGDGSSPNSSSRVGCSMGAGKVRWQRRCLFLCATMPEAGKGGASTRDVADEGSRFNPVNNCSKLGSHSDPSVAFLPLTIGPAPHLRSARSEKWRLPMHDQYALGARWRKKKKVQAATVEREGRLS